MEQQPQQPDDESKPDSQSEIIAAAATCFMQSGLEKATMDDIADVLGATKGRVYHHFRSKNAIYFAVYRQAMQFCFDAIEPIIERRCPPPEKLMEMAATHARVMMDTLPYQRSIRLGVDMYLSGSTTAAEREILAQLIDMRNGYEDRFRAVLEEGQRDGSLAVTDVALAGRALIGALNGLVDWYRVRPEQTDADRERIARTLAGTLLNGLRARP
ncbi:TetR/AcrR family transcriptional regulator [Sulfitobacter sp. HNIBRBA3233]|uniref:TetR/AcrR family transcriptional regulator n=1 Tax=Sulfitobacter marinivivus TaxID=3158558 RepID=UPI0032DE72C8